MKRLSKINLMTVFMVLVCGACLSSCGGDDDDEKSSGNNLVGYWMTGAESVQQYIGYWHTYIKCAGMYFENDNIVVIYDELVQNPNSSELWEIAPGVFSEWYYEKSKRCSYDVVDNKIIVSDGRVLTIAGNELILHNYDNYISSSLSGSFRRKK